MNPEHFDGSLQKQPRAKRKKQPGSSLAYKSDKQAEREEHLAFIKECFLRARPQCWKCGLYIDFLQLKGWTLDLDHIKNRSQGGTDELENLQLLCRNVYTHEGCHPKKTGKPMFTKGTK